MQPAAGEGRTSTQSAKEGSAELQPRPLESNSVARSPGHVQAAIYAGAQPLDHSTRDFFEPKFGFDLRSVRIHTGPQAAESAHALAANAYTLGNDVVLGDGLYQPGTAAGRHLLAHELAQVTQMGSSTGIHRKTIYREPDRAQIMAEIQMRRMKMMAPVNPFLLMQLMRVMRLEAILGQTAGQAAPPSKPKPALKLPFEYRFASAWEKAKKAATQKVLEIDKPYYGGSITRGFMKVGERAPSPREVWKQGVYGGLFGNDEWAIVEERSRNAASESYDKRYNSAKDGNIYGDEDYYESGRARRGDPTEIWSRGRAYGLVLPDERQACAPLRGVKGSLRRAAPALDTAPAGKFAHATAAYHSGIDLSTLISLSRASSQPLNTVGRSAPKSPRRLHSSYSWPAVLKS